ncbi:hypothetical protein AB0L06_35255 [Spirillospora sp. NPDC052269]
MCAATVMDGTTVTLLRRDDMLVVDVDFVNVQRTAAGTGGPVLVPTDTATPAFIVVTFQPQAVIEQVRFQGGPAIGDAAARFSGDTRLAFRFPPGGSIPFTTAGLLGWTGLSNAPDRSGVECVWDLILHPADPAGWTHSLMPVTSAAGVTELWHTRLTDGSQQPIPIGDVRSTGSDTEFPGSLTKAQRSGIAQAAAVRPLLAHELTLSALGATINLTGDWADLPRLSVLGYRHRAVLGRDETVHVAERGFLFPFGFPAKLDTNTERRIADGTAELEQVARLTVAVPELSYDSAVGVPFAGRDLPIRRIHLDGPLVTEVSTTDLLAEGIFWVDTPSGDRLAVDFTAEDGEGHLVSFSAPVAFVPQARAFGGLGSAVLGYDQQRAQIPSPARGQICIAPDGRDKAFDVTALYIGAREADAPEATLREAGQLAALPRLAGVDARVPELEVFDAAARERRIASVPTTLNLDQNYVQQGLALAGIYASLKSPVAFAPPAAGVGGVAVLGMAVSGLSRTTGLVGGDLEALRSGRFDPAKFLAVDNLPGMLPPTLLGFVKLADLVDVAPVGDGEAVPRVSTEIVYPGGDRSKPPTVRSVVAWSPKVKPGLFEGTLRTTPDTRLELHSTTSVTLHATPPVAPSAPGGTPPVDLGAGEPTSDVRGELKSFSLEFAGQVLVIDFARVAFVARPGTSPSLDVKITNVGFGGDMRFLNTLRRYLPSPPNGLLVTASAEQIDVGYTLAIPTVSTGVFLLQNLALSATVSLPLTRKPVRARFAVSGPDDPFLLTVSLFGGGGYVVLEVEGDRVVGFAAALEFGAATALDVGIASASVAVTAGVYIGLTSGKAELGGFFRAVGELDVAGLVQVAVEIYLSLSYRQGPRGSEAHGSATLTVRVRVLTFAQSVTLSLERSFGTGADPTFDKAFPTAEPWLQRCAAFGPTAAAS